MGHNRVCIVGGRRQVLLIAIGREVVELLNDLLQRLVERIELGERQQMVVRTVQESSYVMNDALYTFSVLKSFRARLLNMAIDLR
jgi:hypothetical protein